MTTTPEETPVDLSEVASESAEESVEKERVATESLDAADEDDA